MMTNGIARLLPVHITKQYCNHNMSLPKTLNCNSIRRHYKFAFAIN